jgi:ADP-heptose:LPS heptosyltransferase
MKCPICTAILKDLDFHFSDYLFATKDDNAIHVHGNTENQVLMHELIDAAVDRTRLQSDFSKNSNALLNISEIIFHNRQRIGDMLMFTCAVRDFKAMYPKIKVNVISTAMHIWDNNPYIDSSVKPFYKNGKTLETITIEDFNTGDTNVIKIGPGKGTNQSNRIDWHFANAYRLSIEDSLGIRIQQGESRPDIWMTEEEYNAPRLFKEPYWLIVTGGEKGWGCKMYPFERWQEFVSKNPDTTFVQLGTKGDNHPKLQGPNVIDYIGKTEDRNTGIRDLYKLFLNAEGSIGLVSFHMHLSGALYKPCIVVAGAREPVSFTRYPGHQYLSTDGCLPCSITACWACALQADQTNCKLVIVDESKKEVGDRRVPKCVDMIYPEDLTRALNQYYIGGRLKKGVVSTKPKNFKNIVKTPIKIQVPEVPKVDETKPEDKQPQAGRRINDEFNMAWGSTSIFEEDWMFMKKIIDDYSVSTVLEFGAGLSTLIMASYGLNVDTYETDQKWIDSVKKINSKCKIHLWDGSINAVTGHYDMAFVDGPVAFGKFILGRQTSTEIASKSADIVLIHDATRVGEMLWQKNYLEGNFDLVAKGGKWQYCHLWVKKGCYDKVKPTISVEPSTERTSVVDCAVKSPSISKTIKLVSTARGWGGCGRSVATIMKLLIKDGHQVEFIPFRNMVGSKEFIDFLKKNPQIKVTENYDTIKESCDILFMYGDDFIWEFGKNELIDNTFSNIGADKKILMLNYRRGGVGEVPWTKNFDKYMFLNSIQEKELLNVLPGVKTKVLPPCTELDDFIKVQLNYNNSIRIVRHSSQGDTKFDKENTAKEITSILECRPDVTIDMLPGPSFIAPTDRFIKHGRTDKTEVIANFLANGNLFWYSLPKGYPDQGPRVVLEAMAAGLPILADNWGGVVDRVTPECGWLCDTKEQMVEVVKSLTPEIIEQKGKAARQRAIDEFVPEKWIKEILEV